MKFRREVALIALLGVLLLSAPAHAARHAGQPPNNKSTIAELIAKVKKFIISTFDDEEADWPTPPRP